MSLLDTILYPIEKLGEDRERLLSAPRSEKETFPQTTSASSATSAPEPKPNRPASQPGTAVHVPTRVRGKDLVVESLTAEMCFHCQGEKTCRCAGCAIAGATPMSWEPGQCRACLGTGFLCWPEKQQTPPDSPQQRGGCPGPALCQGCYEIGRREDGTPVYIHPPKSKPIEWPKLATEKLQ